MKIALIVLGIVLVVVAILAIMRKPAYEPKLKSTYVGDPFAYSGNKTLLVAIYAPWASVWKAATEAELTKADPAEYDLLLVSADRERPLVRQLGVEIVPTVLVIRNGKTVKVLPNLMSFDQVK